MLDSVELAALVALGVVLLAIPLIVVLAAFGAWQKRSAEIEELRSELQTLTARVDASEAAQRSSDDAGHGV